MTKALETPVKPVRTSRGFRLRSDLVKACHLIAVEEDRRLYEVIEEALVDYLALRKEEKAVERYWTSQGKDVPV